MYIISENKYGNIKRLCYLQMKAMLLANELHSNHMKCYKEFSYSFLQCHHSRLKAYITVQWRSLND